MVVSDVVDRAKSALDRKCRNEYYQESCPLEKRLAERTIPIATSTPCWLCKKHLVAAEDVALALEGVIAT